MRGKKIFRCRGMYNKLSASTKLPASAHFLFRWYSLHLSGVWQWGDTIRNKARAFVFEFSIFPVKWKVCTLSPDSELEAARILLNLGWFCFVFVFKLRQDWKALLFHFRCILHECNVNVLWEHMLYNLLKLLQVLLHHLRL